MKFELIEAQKAHFPIELMCGQLGVSRSGFYAWQKCPQSQRQRQDEELAQQVAAVHQQSRGTYGSPRVLAELRAQGRKVALNLLQRHFSPGQPNCSWATDITYVFTLHLPRDRRKAKAKKRSPLKRPRRWVVERGHPWMNRSCRLLVRWEKREHLPGHAALRLGSHHLVPLAPTEIGF